MTHIWTRTWEASDAVSSALILNDSDDSVLGPGVWLDTDVNIFLQPNYTFRTNLEGARIVPQSRFLDPPHYKRFGVNIYGLQGVEPGREYFIEWTTPRGEADFDNALWRFDEGQTCGFAVCTYYERICYVTWEEYGVGVIMGGAQFDYDAPFRCFGPYNFLNFVMLH